MGMAKVEARGVVISGRCWMLYDQSHDTFLSHKSIHT